MENKILLFKTYSDEEDIKAVTKVIGRGTWWANGPEVEEFEKSIANYLGRNYAVAFNSGSSALYSLLMAHGIKDGEVILPSYTFVATANAVIASGAKPIFADIEQETLGLDIEDVRKKITEKTRAIIPVHIAGYPCKDLVLLKKLAEDHNIPLIEDAAHGLGTKLNNKNVGTFGDSAMLSFAPNKTLSTGIGGMAVTDSEEIYEKLKSTRAQGRSNKETRDYSDFGFNFLMSSFTAALGVSQFKKIDWLISKRKEMASYIYERLKNIKELTLPTEKKDIQNVFLFYNILLKNKSERDNLQEHLKKNGIPSRITYMPVHLFEYYREKFGYKEGDLPTTEDISQRILTIPFYPTLPKEQLDYILEKIEEYFK